MSEFWQSAKIGDIAAVILSGVDKHIVAGEVPIRLCNYLDVYRNRRLTSIMPFALGSATPEEIDRFSLQKNDVVITKDSETPDDIAIPAVVVDDLPNTICGYHLAILRPGNSVDSRFLLHYFQSDAAKRHFLRTANGVTRFGLGMQAIASLPVLLPSLDEQVAIVRILEAVDSASTRTRAALERARSVRKGLLTDLLIFGIGKDGRVRDHDSHPSDFVATAIGPLPVSWTVTAVGKEFDLQNGFTINQGRRARFRKRRYLRVANVQRDSLDLSDVQELEASESEFAPRVLMEGDLLVVEGHADRMQIGRCERHLDWWGRWLSLYPEHHGWWNDPDAADPADPLETPVKGLLRLKPAHLLDFLQHFIVFETKKGKTAKKIARYQQFEAVNELVDRTVSLAGTQATPQERTGLIWHTQGSGKSLTMIFAGQKLRRHSALNNPTVLIVVDRRDLKTQLSDDFDACDYPNVEKALGVDDLKKKLRTDWRGTVVTTVQAFQRMGDLAPLTRDNIISMVDECHRSQKEKEKKATR